MDTAALLNLRLAGHQWRHPDRTAAGQALTHMQSLVRRSVHLVGDLFDMVRADAGHRLPFAPVEVDLVALVRQAVLDQPADTYHVMLTQRNRAVGWWDADRLARLLENLLGNAIKYSPAGTPITVRIRRNDADLQHWAVLEVEDRGVGIPANELSHVFDPFYRGANVQVPHPARASVYGPPERSWSSTAEL
jgi:signal transduction histidine kinase